LKYKNAKGQGINPLDHVFIIDTTTQPLSLQGVA